MAPCSLNLGALGSFRGDHGQYGHGSVSSRMRPAVLPAHGIQVPNVVARHSMLETCNLSAIEHCRMKDNASDGGHEEEYHNQLGKHHAWHHNRGEDEGALHNIVDVHAQSHFKEAVSWFCLQEPGHLTRSCNHHGLGQSRDATSRRWQGAQVMQAVEAVQHHAVSVRKAFSTSKCTRCAAVCFAQALGTSETEVREWNAWAMRRHLPTLQPGKKIQNGLTSLRLSVLVGPRLPRLGSWFVFVGTPLRCPEFEGNPI